MPQARPQKPAQQLSLALLGLGLAGLCALLALRYPLLPSLLVPRASWTDLADPGWPSLLLHTANLGALTLLYVLALRLLLHERDTAWQQAPVGEGAAAVPGAAAETLRDDFAAQRTVAPGAGGVPAFDQGRFAIIALTWLVCSGLLMAAAPAGESHDVFDYLFRGRMMTELGANPLAEIPDAFPRAPFYRYVGWRSHVDTYGPAWELASRATTLGVRRALRAAGRWQDRNVICPGSPGGCGVLTGSITGYRLLAVGLTGLTGWLVAAMVQRNRPALAPAALAAWLWSPVLLVSAGVGAHNDALMLFFLTLMLWLLQRKRWLLALLALALAVHVKVIALVAAPAAGLWLVRRCGWRRALALGAAGAALGLLLSWALYRPFGGWGSLERMLAERTSYLANSPWQVLDDLLRLKALWTPDQRRHWTVQLPTLLAAAAVAMAALWMLDFRPRRWKASRAPDWRDDRLLWRTLAACWMLYLVIGAFWFQHWYVAWVLAPAALLPDSGLTRLFLPWLGFGALAANFLGAFARAALPAGRPRTGLYVLVVAIIWGPALAAAAWSLGRRARPAGKSPSGPDHRPATEARAE